VSKQTVLIRERREKMKKSPSQGMDRRTFLKASGAMGLGTVATFTAPGDISAQSGPKVTEKSPGEMIDMFPHILPAKYNKALLKKARPCYYLEANSLRPALANLEERLKFMDKVEGLREVLTLGSPPPEYALSPEDAVDLVRMANDEMAELVNKYPDRFPAAVASLPMNDLDASLREIDRAVNELKFKGIQIFTSINGRALDRPEFFPIYEKMAQYDLPIWLHPCRDQNIPDYPGEKAAKYGLFLFFGWPYETTLALGRLVFSGVMEKYPNLRWIAHHCGAMIPFLTARIAPQPLQDGEIMKLAKPPIEYFKRIYADTVLGGNTASMMCGYAFFGADHMLFGTDYPYPGDAAHEAIIEAIGRMNITGQEKTKIFFRNARQLLKLA
jgi:predicted TIM-barrel fold metal-dependent hydrolase